MSHATLALAITYILWSFEYGLVEPYWVVYAEEMINLSSAEWGAIIVAGNTVSLAAKVLLVGKVLDKFERRKVLLTVIAFDTLTYLLFVQCKTFIQVVSLWVPASMIWAFYEATYSSIEADLVPKEKRGRVFAIFSVAWSAFGIPASLVGGAIYELVNPQLSFVLAATIVIICFIVTSKFIRIPREALCEVQKKSIVSDDDPLTMSSTQFLASFGVHTEDEAMPSRQSLLMGNMVYVGSFQKEWVRNLGGPDFRVG